MQVTVRNNNIDQALRALKKKLQREGVFREMKRKAHYVTPSEQRRLDKAKNISNTFKKAAKKYAKENAVSLQEAKATLKKNGRSPRL